MTVQMLPVQPKDKLISHDEAIYAIDAFAVNAALKRDQGEHEIVVGPRIYDKIFLYILEIKDKPFQWEIKEIKDFDQEDSMTLYVKDYYGDLIGLLKIRPPRK